jgi:iron-sulfur cluster assembly enzyme ISCU, mitochondrial
MFSRAFSRSLLSAAPRAAVNASRPAVVRPARPVIARAYHEKVISHYESPRNVRFI